MSTRGIYALPVVRDLFATFAAIRTARGWSQARLAEEMGTGQSWVCDVEVSRRPDPQISSAVRMAQALGLRMVITVDDPVTGDRWTVPLTDTSYAKPDAA